MYQFVKPSLSFATLMESKQEVDFSEDSGDDEAVFAIRSVAASSVPEFNAEVFAAQPLRKQFVEAQRLFVNQAEKSKVGAKAALDRFLIVQKGIMQAAIFSNNESVEEIATGDLKYLLVHSYLAKLYLFASDFETNARIQSLKDSLKSSFDYLSLCQAFELLAPHDQMLWRQLKQTLKNLDRDDLKANSAKDTLNASQLREIKIAQFKTKKENQQKLAAIQAKMEKLKSKNDDDDEVDDEMEREFLLVTIQDSIGECLSDASINLSELDLLKQRQKLLEQNPKADQNVPLSVIFEIFVHDL
jgi:immunoglobulin-binding protein 1